MSKHFPINLCFFIVLLLLFSAVAVFSEQGFLKANNTIQQQVFWHYYLAVIVAAVLVGAILGLTGAILQVLLKNPLADAGVLGISSGSQFIGLLLLFFLQASGFTAFSFISFYIACVLGALLVLVVFLVILLTQNQLENIAIIILVGVGLAAIFSALTTLLMSFSNHEILSQIIIWQFGGFSSISWPQNFLLGIVGIIFCIFAYYKASIFDMFSLGEKEANLMGVNIKALFCWLMILMALLIATTVAIAGPIGFVGLVSPHIARLLLKVNNMVYLMTLSMSIGAIIMLAATYCSLNIAYPMIIPVGIITALIGAPFLIGLVIRQLSNH